MGAPFSYAPPRVVLFPLGTVDDPKAKEALMTALIKCGADLDRLLDQRFLPSPGMDDLDKYIQYLDRLARRNTRLASDLNRAIVVLGRGNPPGLTVIQTSRRLVQALPMLRTAVWCIFADHIEEPQLMTNLDDPRLGEFDDAFCPAPVWKGRHGLEYLIVSSLCANPDYDLGYLVSRFNDVASRAEKARFGTGESTTNLRAITSTTGKD